MDIQSCYRLEDIIKELEMALQISGSDFEEKDVDAIIKNVKARIGRQYQLDMTYKLNAPELNAPAYRDSLDGYLDILSGLHAKLCGYGQLVRFRAKNDISLYDINYLGYTPDSLKEILDAFQRDKFRYMSEPHIVGFKEKLKSISTCTEKRLFVLLVISCELGLPEITATIAELLYWALVK